MIGSTLQDRYRIEALIGRGGAGEVYRAHDQRLGREVAVKVVQERSVDEEGRERLLREARAAAALNHPRIVAVHDAGEAQGHPFIVMELIPGSSLRSLGPLGLDETLEIGRQMCEALAHAHAHGIVHRDVKPENVLVVRENGRLSAKLADLGLAFTAVGTRLTGSAWMVGTAAYMAPEQALGGAVDGRADLYALGVMLYELAAGRHPFPGDDPIAIVSQHLHAPVVPPRTYRPDLPAELEAVVLRLMAKRAEDRFASAREVGAALAAVPTAAARLSPAAAAETDSVRLLQQLVRGRLVGRGGPLVQLRELWTRAERGEGHLALISGEPGIGKTRLAREVAVFARLQGAHLLQGGCYEFEAATPYLPFVEALRGWVRGRDADGLRKTLGSLATELAKLAPEIETRLGPLPPNPELPPSEDRLRLFDHVARFFQSLAAERGALLVLDDLHWADHGTLALLHYLLRQTRESRLLVLGAYREAELDRAHPLQKSLVEWNRERLATRVPLGRLSLEDTASMLAVLFAQSDVSPDFTAALYRETDGNPFFVEEVVKALIEQGQIYREAGEWQRKDVDELAIPQSIKAAVSRRLDRLTPTCTEALQTAAALGKIFDFQELAAATAVAESPLLDALDEAVASQLIRSEGGESFVFTHDKIREVLHQELNPIRQRRLHQRIGQSLETLHAKDIEGHVEDLAYHFVRSGDLEKGLTYSMRAAEQAERLYAHAEALGFFERARECAEALERVDELARIEECMGDVWWASGESKPAVDHYERALALERGKERRLSIQCKIGEVYGRIGDPRGLPLLEALLTELDPERQPVDTARTLTMVGRYHHYRGQHHAAIEHYQRALVLAERAGNQDVIGVTYSYLAGAYQHLTRFRESDGWARREIEFGERHGLPVAVAVGHEFLAENCVNRGEWDRAVKHARLDREHGEKAHSQERVAWSEFAESEALFCTGDLAGARRVAEAARARGRRIGEMRVALLAELVLASALFDLGLEDEGRALAEAARGESASLGMVFHHVEAHRVLAYQALQSRRFDEVIAHVEETRRILEGTESRGAPMRFSPLPAEALVRLERWDEAEQAIENALELTRSAEASHFEALALRAQALMLAAQDREAADAALTDVVDRFERLGTRLELARALLDRGLLRGRRKDARARDDLERSLELATACGAPRDQRRAEMALGELREGGA